MCTFLHLLHHPRRFKSTFFIAKIVSLRSHLPSHLPPQLLPHPHLSLKISPLHLINTSSTLSNPSLNPPEGFVSTKKKNHIFHSVMSTCLQAPNFRPTLWNRTSCEPPPPPPPFVISSLIAAAKITPCQGGGEGGTHARWRQKVDRQSSSPTNLHKLTTNFTPQ